MDTLALDPAAATLVAELRAENGKWRTRTHAAENALSFYVNKYPLGDEDNFHVSRAAYAKAMSKGSFSGPYWDKYAKWEKGYLEQKAKQGDQVSGADGGFLAPEFWSTRWFDLLRNFTVFDRLPIVRLTVPYRIAHIPRVMGDITINYPGENASLTNTQFKFGQLSYGAHKSTVEIYVSNEEIRDAPELADQVFRQSSAAAVAADADNQLLSGQGGPNPVGLITLASDGTGGGGTSGTIAKYYAKGTATTSIDTTPAHGTPSFLHISQLRSKVTNLNASTAVTAGQARCTGIIAHSRFEQSVHTLAAAASAWTDAQGRPLWMGGLNGDGGPNADGSSGGLMGLSWALTNALSVTSADGGGTTSSFIIAGYWQRYVYFECLTPTYDAVIDAADTSSTGFSADQTSIRVTYRYDGSPAQPEAFAVLAGCDQ